MAGIVIRTDFEPCELRALAKSEKDARVTRRLLAIAGALEGLSRADAGRVGGMDRQTLRENRNTPPITKRRTDRDLSSG